MFSGHGLFPGNVNSYIVKADPLQTHSVAVKLVTIIDRSDMPERF